MTSPSPSPSPTLSRAQVDALQAELDALRNETLAKVGTEDARTIRRVVRIARGSAIAGRSLLMFGFDPFTWVLGVLALALAKILDNMMIGHNVLHGQYDWMNDPSLDSQTFEWDIAGTSADWRHAHNFRHHTFTNILGKDRDFGYDILRLSEQQKWRPLHLLQPLWNALLALNFQWGVGIQELELGKRLKGRMTDEELRRRATPFLRKAGGQLFKDYLLFPALALWNAPRVLLGNLAANLLRNLWTYAIIFCGHFTAGAKTFTREETANETRGDWYLRQLQGSSNLEGGHAFHVLSGYLSHQIEHHLFPDIPAPRYAELAPKVQDLCRRYGVAYNTGSFWKQYGQVLGRVFKHALPTRPARPAGPARPALAI